MKKHIFFIACLAMLLTSLTACRSYKDQAGITYLKNVEMEAQQALAAPYSLKIKPDDELQITISSTVPQATSQYNLPAVNFIGRGEKQVTTNNNIATYTVSETGHIVIPNLGKILVAGSTPEELSDLLVSKISEEVKDPIVKVDLKNFRVVVLGQVKAPGTKFFQGQRCSIFDALGAAEDITLYGRRDNVLLMREEAGEVKTIHLDLTNSDILASPYYYLQQNDVLIVEATDVQKENSNYNTMNSFRLQTTSTIVSVVSVIASLCITLWLR